MTKDEALKRSLEQLEFFDRSSHQHGYVWQKHLITAIKEALAQPEQEPVAYWNVNGGFSHCMIDKLDEAAKHNPAPLYTSPPQRHPLTEEKQIAEDLRFHGLQLVKTVTGYAVLKLGQVAAHNIKEIK